MASFQAKIGWNRLTNKEKKIVVPFRSHPTRNRKFQKNSKKIQKIKKPCYDFFSNQKKFESLTKRENKNYRFVSFLPYG